MIVKNKDSVLLRSKDNGLYVCERGSSVLVTSFIRTNEGGSETTVEIPRELWNSFAGTSLRMAQEGRIKQ